MIDSLWNLTLENSLRGSLLITCVLLLRAILHRQLPAQYFHLLWLIVGIRLLLPMAPSSSLSAFNLVTTPAPVSNVTTSGEWQLNTRTSSEAETTELLSPQHAASLSKATPHWFAMIWLSGVAVQIAWLANSLFRTHRKLKEALEISDPDFLRLLARCADEAGFHSGVRAFETDAVSTPAVVGMWRPKLLLPGRLRQQLSDDELHLVLLHECTHLRRRDLAALWLITSARIVHWFNPLVWIAAHAARTDTEIACDQAVLRDHDTPQAYGRTLLKLATRGLPQPPIPHPGLGMLGSKHTIHRRIERIGRFSPQTRLQGLAGILLLAAVTIAFGSDEASVAVTPAPGKSRTPAETQQPTPRVTDADPFAGENALMENQRQIRIAARFIELPAEDVTKIIGVSQEPGGVLVISTEKQTIALIKKLNEAENVDLLSAPRVTTVSGQTATIEILHEFRYPSEWEEPAEKGGAWIPKKHASEDLGISLKIKASIDEQDGIDLELNPKAVEVIGFVNPLTGEPIAGASPDETATFLKRIQEPKTLETGDIESPVLPVFSIRSLETNLTLAQRHSVILVLQQVEGSGKIPPKEPDNVLLLLLTSEIAGPDGTPQGVEPPPSEDPF